MIRTKIKSQSPAKNERIIKSTHGNTTCVSIADRSSSPLTMERVCSSAINDSLIREEQQSIMANYIERAQVFQQKLEALRGISRIQRRNSLGSGWATPNNKMINATMDGLVACLDQKMASTNPELGSRAFEVFDRIECLEFEPMDPFETALEPDFAEELIRILNLA
jgi:hypothetical protein